MAAPAGTYSGPYVAPMPSRPLGVAILAVLIALFGILELIVGLVLLVLLLDVHLLFPGVSGVTIAGSAWLGAGLLAIFGLILLGVSVGLWRLRLWALALCLIVLIAIVIVNVVEGSIVSFGTILSALLIVYLVAVSRHFR